MAAVRSGIGMAILASLVAGCGANLQESYVAPKLKHPSAGGGYSVASQPPAGSIALGRATDGGDKAPSGGSGVDPYLWRAVLETASSLPLNAVDPFGGLVVTDWYAPPDAPGERRKLTILILGRAAQPGGIRVSVFRQIHSASGAWVDAQPYPAVGPQLEGAILSRAQQMRTAKNDNN